MEKRPILAICDRCGNDIPKQNENEIMVLKATNIRWDTETYYLHFILCTNCRKEFEKWVFVHHVDSS